MLLWKAWFDLRQRFYCSLVLMLVLLTVVITVYSILNSTKPPINPSFQQSVQPYSLWIDQNWFGTNAHTCFCVMAIALALGGVPAEKRRGATLMTLTLPVKRRFWLAAHAGMTALLILVLAFVSEAGVLIGGFLIGKSHPYLTTSVMPVFGFWLSCLPLIGISLWLNSYLRDAMRSALILIPISVLAPPMLALLFPYLAKWFPWQLEDPGLWMMWQLWGRAHIRQVIVPPILVSLAIGLVSTALAARRFVQEEC
jgi:ABC-type transport system involved in multi-copper enzyme maturation permease subunit